MVRNNNVIPKNHFRKHWQRYVKTWFNQPARKQRRNEARERKLARTGGCPLKSLRPTVRGQTLRYAAKEKKGRGFNLDELKRAGLTAVFARTVGISVDLRRRTKSVETLTTNVQKLELYKSKIQLHPLRKDKPKKGQINDIVKS